MESGHIILQKGIASMHIHRFGDGDYQEHFSQHAVVVLHVEPVLVDHNSIVYIVSNLPYMNELF